MQGMMTLNKKYKPLCTHSLCSFLSAWEGPSQLVCVVPSMGTQKAGHRSWQKFLLFEMWDRTEILSMCACFLRLTCQQPTPHVGLHRGFYKQPTNITIQLAFGWTCGNSLMCSSLHECWSVLVFSAGHLLQAFQIEEGILQCSFKHLREGLMVPAITVTIVTVLV